MLHLLSQDPARAALKASLHMETAHLIAKAATCLRGQVGAVLLRPDGSVAGTGYNGALPGQPHCNPESCNPSARCLRVRHAERGALDNSGGAAVALAFVTHEPCLRCTQDLVARGCKIVFYAKPYEGDPREATARAFHALCNGVAWTRMYYDGDEERWVASQDYFVPVAGVAGPAAQLLPDEVGGPASVLQTSWGESLVVERVDDDHIALWNRAATTGMIRGGEGLQRFLPADQAAALLRGVL